MLQFFASSSSYTVPLSSSAITLSPIALALDGKNLRVRKNRDELVDILYSESLMAFTFLLLRVPSGM
jgi:hypothetical protein